MPLPVPLSRDLESNQRFAPTRLATNTRIPILLGSAEVQPRILTVVKSGTNWVASIIWCEGPVASISNLLLNSEEPAENTQINHYTGESDQSIDPLLQAALSDYQDRNIYRGQGLGIAMAYSVIQYRDEDYDDVPVFTARVSGVEGSANPIIAIRHFLERAGYSVNEASYSKARELTERTVGGVEDRRQIGLLVDDSQSIRDWVKTLEGYIGGRIVKLGREWHFNMDESDQISAYIHPDDSIEGSLTVTSAVRQNVPNRVEIVYTQTYDDGTLSQEIAFAETTRLQQGLEKPRISQVKLPGIRRYSQAVREAIERLGKLQEAFNEYSLMGIYPLLRLVINDKIEIDIDGERRLCVLTENPRLNMDGTVPLEFSDFSDSVYNESVETRPDITHQPIVIGD